MRYFIYIFLFICSSYSLAENKNNPEKIFEQMNNSCQILEERESEICKQEIVSFFHFVHNTKDRLGVFCVNGSKDSADFHDCLYNGYNIDTMHYDSEITKQEVSQRINEYKDQIINDCSKSNSNTQAPLICAIEESMEIGTEKSIMGEPIAKYCVSKNENYRDYKTCLRETKDNIGRIKDKYSLDFYNKIKRKLENIYRANIMQYSDDVSTQCVEKFVSSRNIAACALEATKKLILDIDNFNIDSLFCSETEKTYDDFLKCRTQGNIKIPKSLIHKINNS